MHVNKYLILAISVFLNSVLFSDEPPHEDLFSAEINYSILSDKKTLFKGPPISSSKVLGGSVIDIKPILKNAGVSISDSDIVLYGPDTNLIYAKGDLESINRIKNLYETHTHSKSVFRLQIDTIERINLVDSSKRSQLDVILISGERIGIQIDYKKRVTVSLTDGLLDSGATKYEIKIGGFDILAIGSDSPDYTCMLDLGKAEAITGFSPEKEIDKKWMMKLDRIELSNNTASKIDHSASQKKQLIEVIHAELAKGNSN